MRKFIVTMSQKGQLNQRLHESTKKHITYEKCDINQMQICCIDDISLNKEYEEYKMECSENGTVVNMRPPLDFVFNVLGINHNNPYYFRNMLREITDIDKPGYTHIDVEYISKETEKAYFVKELDMWIPKSQTILEDNILFIKRWVIQQN